MNDAAQWDVACPLCPRRVAAHAGSSARLQQRQHEPRDGLAGLPVAPGTRAPTLTRSSGVDAAWRLLTRLLPTRAPPRCTATSALPALYLFMLCSRRLGARCSGSVRLCQPCTQTSLTHRPSRPSPCIPSSTTHQRTSYRIFFSSLSYFSSRHFFGSLSIAQPGALLKVAFIFLRIHPESLDHSRQSCDPDDKRRRSPSETDP